MVLRFHSCDLQIGTLMSFGQKPLQSFGLKRKKQRKKHRENESHNIHVTAELQIYRTTI